ncbi:uncharacterized protein BKA78DRAFT_313610 [Phyllosticta capitalensis]|uniref:uncharacterized protein n=1 Tax=Phyllosticta capitalensis TaxID=121624 RepID=UPI00313019DF
MGYGRAPYRRPSRPGLVHPNRSACSRTSSEAARCYHCALSSDCQTCKRISLLCTCQSAVDTCSAACWMRCRETALSAGTHDTSHRWVHFQNLALRNPPSPRPSLSITIHPSQPPLKWNTHLERYVPLPDLTCLCQRPIAQDQALSPLLSTDL